MNEKIKLFAKQAEQYALDKANEGNDEDYDYSFDDDFQEKFAELIVRECVSVAMEQYDDTLPWGGVEDVLKHFDKIAKHFGVKE